MNGTSADGLTVSDVTIAFGGVKALDSVSLRVDRGVWTGLIGPNGSGKTTMLNVVSGVYKPDSGHVGLVGKNLSSARAQRRSRAGIVRTFQHPQLAATLTLRENVELGIDLSRRGGRSDGTKSADAHVSEALELFGCEAYADYLPSQAPYGARKAAEVARAFAAQPVALLLDEPAAGLSREERQELVTALRTAQSVRPDMCVCLIEHDVQLVAAVCTQLQVLNFGKVIARGDAQEVLRNEEVRTAYLGRQRPAEDEEK